MGKQRLWQVLLAAAFLFLLMPWASQAGWQQVGAAGFSAGWAYNMSLAIDSSGTPYVAYDDSANGYKVSVMRFNGTSWQQVGATDFSSDAAWGISLDIDSSGTPYVAYDDSANGYKVSVMRFNGTSWQQVGSAGFSLGSNASNTKLALDSSGTPYVAYIDHYGLDSPNSYNKVIVMKFNGTSWEQVGALDFAPDSTCRINLALDSNDTPYIVYSDSANGWKASVMKFNGTSWEQVGAACFSPDTAWWISLALDSSGTPYVAYQEYANGWKVSVMKFNGTSWEQVGVACFSPDSSTGNISLALDSSGTPYVAYNDSGNGGKASVMKFNGTDWQQMGKGFSLGVSNFINLALDSSGTPYVAYSDIGNGEKASVMRFTDADKDGIADDEDNCPFVANTDQADADGDGLGDACDTCPADADNDKDKDAVCGNVDNCPLVANADQADADGDGLGDACDACPADADNDKDKDAVCGNTDNCPLVANADQADADGDGKGDACDAVHKDMSTVYTLLLRRKAAYFWDFERPPVPAGGWQPFAPDQISGWIVEHTFPLGKTSPPQLEIWNHLMSAPYSGNQNIELDSDDSTTISQSVATVPGSRYVLKYTWAPRPGGAENRMKVWVNGSETALHQASGVGHTTIHCTVSQHEFTAAGTSTSIAFGEVGQDDGVGMLLDAVSLVQQ